MVKSQSVFEELARVHTARNLRVEVCVELPILKIRMMVKANQMRLEKVVEY